MTTQELANKFVEMCKQFKNFEVMQTLYADHITSVEALPNDGGVSETTGKEAVIAKSAKWASENEIHGADCNGPFLAGNRFAVTFDFAITPKATGQKMDIREIAVYTVDNGLIVREEFFYGDNPQAFTR
ncbi:MAG: nuclear transport factor 2 family protein [Bryobacter sp.]|nr:nuclear transport factor 2 family protein [Bryobacter sp.]